MEGEDSPDSTFTWKIENFSKLAAETEKLKSDTFAMYGHKWNICLHPKSTQRSHLGIFLSAADPKWVPSGCSILAEFSLAVINQTDPTQTLTKRSSMARDFGDPDAEWGWQMIAYLTNLNDPSAGFLVDDTLVVKAHIIMKPNLFVSPVSEASLHDFATLFEDIHRVVAASSSSSPMVSSSVGADHHLGPDEVETALSLFLLRQETGKSFSEVHSSRLGTELSSALKHLAQATTSLPRAQATAVADFSGQFEELCQSYTSNIAVLDAAQQFFESKDDTFSSLKRSWYDQVKTKESIDKVGKENQLLESELMELEDSKSLLFREYATIGKKAQRLKTEWGEIIAREEDMIKQSEKAVNKVAEIEGKWSNFIALFK